jgi:hypothetical protein
MHPALFYRLPWLFAALQRGGAGLLLLVLTLPLAAQHRWAAGAVVLDTLTARPLVCAVGVAEGGDEVLVFNGQAHTTSHRPDGATETTAGFRGRAAWLLRSRVTCWNDAGAVPATVTTPAQLAHFIREAARRAGLDAYAGQPFQLLGQPSAVWWQVAAFPTASPADVVGSGLGARGRFAPGPVDLVGFLLPCPKRRQPARLHLHARPGAQPFVAHVDSLRPGPGLRLLLPALP